MFYIISSRIPLISSDKTNRKYFKLFVSGAVSYVLLHYYLNKEVMSGMVEKIRKYIYYVMCIDFAIACVLLKYIKTNVPNIDESDDEKEDDEKEDDENENKKSNSNINNKQKLSRELEEQRRLFLEEHQRKLLQEKMLQQKAQALALAQAQEQEKKNKVKTESEKTESEKTESEKSESEKTETEKIKSEKRQKKTEKKKEKKEEKKVKDETDEKTNVTDTEIPLPIYNN